MSDIPVIGKAYNIRTGKHLFIFFQILQWNLAWTMPLGIHRTACRSGRITPHVVTETWVTVHLLNYLWGRSTRRQYSPNCALTKVGLMISTCSVSVSFVSWGLFDIFLVLDYHSQLRVWLTVYVSFNWTAVWGVWKMLKQSHARHISHMQ